MVRFVKFQVWPIRLKRKSIPFNPNGFRLNEMIILLKEKQF